MQPTHTAADLQARRAMERYFGGDESAIDLLFRAITPRIRAFFLRRTRDESVSDDLVQETLLRFYAGRARLDRRVDVMPLVFTIARRLLIDRSRRQHRDAIEPLPLDGDAESADALPDAIAEYNELAQRVLSSLSQLPAAHREAFELIRHDGLSVAEAAAQLGTTVCAVKLRTYRASVALHAELEAA